MPREGGPHKHLNRPFRCPRLCLLYQKQNQKSNESETGLLLTYQYGLLRKYFKMGQSENRSFRLIGQAADFPTVGENNLLDHRESQACALFLGGKIGFENLGASLGGHARAVVAHLDQRFGGAGPLGHHLDFAIPVYGLDSVKQEVEKGLTEELFVGLDTEHLAADFEPDSLFLKIVIQGANHLVDDRAQRQCRAADFTRTGVINELV